MIIDNNDNHGGDGYIDDDGSVPQSLNHKSTSHYSHEKHCTKILPISPE